MYDKIRDEKCRENDNNIAEQPIFVDMTAL